VSAHEYSDAEAIAFEDVEAFSARNVRVQQIKLYGVDTALDRVLYQVAAAFSVVGGPLDGVFRSSTAELGLASDTALVRADDGGFAVAVDGHEITVGRGEYMIENGVKMYYDADDERQLAGGKVNIMYAADNGKLTAKFYIRYKMDEDFERDVELLHRKGIRAVLRTYDPNIREEMIEKISFVGRLGVRTVRKTAAQLGDDFLLTQIGVLHFGIGNTGSAGKAGEEKDQLPKADFAYLSGAGKIGLKLFLREGNGTFGFVFHSGSLL
jgi:hypothetical protein